MSDEVRTFTMKRLSAISLLIILSVIAFVPVYAEQPGEALFKAKCAMCHGADAAGKTPMGAKLNIPDLRSPQIHKLSLADLEKSITKGKNKMTPFEGKLSSAEISQVAKYVHDLK